MGDIRSDVKFLLHCFGDAHSLLIGSHMQHALYRACENPLDGSSLRLGGFLYIIVIELDNYFNVVNRS